MTFENIISKMGSVKILLIGDLMLDQYIYGKVNRISPEAPVPVFLTNKKNEMVGGAGNVLKNLHTLGVKTYFISLVGNDVHGKTLTSLISGIAKNSSHIYKDKNRSTTLKTRYLSENQQLFRVDKEDTNDISVHAYKYILSKFNKYIYNCDAVVVSDYNKGVISENLIKFIIKKTRSQKKPVIIDPKNKNFHIFKGATLVTPNKKEASDITNMPTDTDQEVEECAKKIIKNYKIKNVLITRGNKGISFVDTKRVIHLPTEAKDVYDVSGAGDTVLAMFSSAFSSKLDLETCVNLANIAAGIVVGKLGTASVNLNEVKNKFLLNSKPTLLKKIIQNKDIESLVSGWKSKGFTIGFTNGCFDIIHPGHIELIEKTKSYCDKLIIGLNSDASIKKLKGLSRPIQNQNSRIKILSALESCDKICLFSENTPIKLIQKIRPHILSKGGDYNKKNIVGYKEVKSWGGKILIVDLVKNKSTSNIIKRAQISS